MVDRALLERWHLKAFSYHLSYRVTRQLKMVRVIAVVGDSQDEQSFRIRLADRS